MSWARRLVGAFVAGCAVAVALLPGPAEADTVAGWAAADQALKLAAYVTPFADPDGDLRLFIHAWLEAGVTIRGADQALLHALDPAGRVGGGRGDGPAHELAALACGGPVAWTWEVDRGDQPARGDLVLYRPPPLADGPAPMRVGIVVSQVAVVAVQAVDGAMRATRVAREQLFHAQQASAADVHVADSTTEVGFCHVAAALIPAALRAVPGGSGSISLVDPDQVAATLAWNADHPRDRDGGMAIVRMLEIFASIPGAGAGAVVGLVIFGGAAVHDSTGGVLGMLTAPFAVLRTALSWTFDGSPLHRALTAALLVFLGLKLLGMPFALSLSVGVTLGATGAMELSVGRGFRPWSWIWAAAWALASYAVSITTGIDDSAHVSGLTLALTVLGDAAIILGGSRLFAVSATLTDLVRDSSVGRGLAALGRWVRDDPVLIHLRGSTPVRVIVDGERGVATFGQTVLGRVGNLLGGKPSAFAPSGTELAKGGARLVGGGLAAEVAPRTVAEAISSARVGALGASTSWSAVSADTYGVALRSLDVASWFTWRPSAVAGDAVSMANELAEWLAGRLVGGDVRHPFVRAVDSLLGHLDPLARQRVVEAALPALSDAARLGSLHSGGQLAGSVFDGATPLPVPSLPSPPAISAADVGATWGAMTVRPHT